MLVDVWPLFVSLGLLALTLGLLIPTPTARPAGLIAAAIMFGIAVIVAFFPLVA